MHRVRSIKGQDEAAGLELVVETVEVTRLSHVDAVKQQFKGQFLFILRIEGGARDEDLCCEDEVVNRHDDGTLHPSAVW